MLNTVFSKVVDHSVSTQSPNVACLKMALMRACGYSIFSQKPFEFGGVEESVTMLVFVLNCVLATKMNQDRD